MYKVIGVDQKVYGPVSAALIRQWLNEGRLNAASLAQAEGAADWKPLSMFLEFIPPPVITPPPPAQPVTDGAGGMATAGLVLGIVSNICCGVGFLFGIAGLVFSILALQRMERHPQQSGRAMAWIGLGLSIFGILSSFILPLATGLMGGFWHPRHWRML